MDGERFGKGLRQMQFFRKRRRDKDADDFGAADDADADEDEDDEPDDPPEPAAAPKLTRASGFHQGEFARRMMGVEDRMQGMTDETFGALLHVLHGTARDLVEVWTAYDRFCRDRLGVSAETMLAAWQFPTGGEVTAMLKRYVQVQPRQEMLAEYYGIYCRSWDRKFGEVDE